MKDFSYAPFSRGLRILVGLVAAALLSSGAGAACPGQTATGISASCGTDYGADMEYCYAGGQDWWYKEHVVQGHPNTCQPSDIDQTTNPIQSASGCLTDEVENSNGPPQNVAPCDDVTNQTVYAGPTQATVNQCNYHNTQRITVTSVPRRVTTTSAGAAIHCSY